MDNRIEAADIRAGSRLAGIIILLTGMLVLLLLAGCSTDRPGGTTTEGDGEMPTYTISNDDNMKFMMETYGLTEDELAGLDLEKLISDYGLRDEDYTAEEIRQIIREQGDMYQDDGTTAIYSILEAPQGDLLKEDDAVECIGYYVNSGSMITRAVFDLKEGEAYINDAKSHSLTDDQIALLKIIPSNYGVYDWAAHTEGEEAYSTGNFKWTFVFYTADGRFCVYDGYTKDMSNLPEGFSEAYRDFRVVIDEIR